MVIIIILAIIAAAVLPQIVTKPEQIRERKVKQDILMIQGALDLYKMDNGFYPTTEQGLQALVAKPLTQPVPLKWRESGYLKMVPTDPWGKPYQFLNNAGKISVFTYMPSAKSNSQKIISNKQIELE